MLIILSLALCAVVLGFIFSNLALSSFLSALAGVLVIVMMLSFLVIIHELGHFFAALWAGVKVEEFGVGYPPRAKTLFKYKGTPFTLNWIPFGGFVRLEGEESEDGDESESEAKVSAQESRKTLKSSKASKVSSSEITSTLTARSGTKSAFYSKPFLSRLVVILAGAAANITFGLLAFTLVFSIMGIPDVIDVPFIAQVMPDSPASKAGVPERVQIQRIIDSKGVVTELTTAHEVIESVSSYQGETIQLVVTGKCSGPAENCAETSSSHSVYVRRKSELPSGQGSLGISFEPKLNYKHYPWYQMPFVAAWYGMLQTVAVMQLILQSLAGIILELTRGSAPTGVAGPVGIVHSAVKENFASHSFLQQLNMAGMLSINLGLMNVLPIPALDGGRALFLFLEKIIGKKRMSLFENKANTVGFFILLALIVLVTVGDIKNLFVK